MQDQLDIFHLTNSSLGSWNPPLLIKESTHNELLCYGIFRFVILVQ